MWAGHIKTAWQAKKLVGDNVKSGFNYITKFYGDATRTLTHIYTCDNGHPSRHIGLV